MCQLDKRYHLVELFHFINFIVHSKWQKHNIGRKKPFFDLASHLKLTRSLAKYRLKYDTFGTFVVFSNRTLSTGTCHDMLTHRRRMCCTNCRSHHCPNYMNANSCSLQVRVRLFYAQGICFCLICTQCHLDPYPLRVNEESYGLESGLRALVHGLMIWVMDGMHIWLSIPNPVDRIMFLLPTSRYAYTRAARGQRRCARCRPVQRVAFAQSAYGGCGRWTFQIWRIRD